MSRISGIFEVWKRIFGKRKYLILALIFGFVFYILNGFILNVQNLGSFYEVSGALGAVKLAFVSSLVFLNLLSTFGAIGIVVLSVLVGMLFSLMLYRFEYLRGKKGEGGFLGSIGLFLGLAAPGCACGVGLVSLLGVSSALAFLPFNGQEVVVFAVLVVAFSVVIMSRDDVAS